MIRIISKGTHRTETNKFAHALVLPTPRRANGGIKGSTMYFPASLKMCEDIQPEETLNIPVAQGHVSFTDSFRYLGTLITTDLKEDKEIKTRITKATQSMGALCDFFRNKDLDLRTKLLIYLAIPVKNVLWGCDSWGCTQVHTDRLNAFHHKSIRSILGIDMHQVKEERIKNEKVREMFFNMRPMDDIIKLSFKTLKLRTKPEGRRLS